MTFYNDPFYTDPFYNEEPMDQKKASEKIKIIDCDGWVRADWREILHDIAICGYCVFSFEDKAHPMPIKLIDATRWQDLELLAKKVRSKLEYMSQGDIRHLLNELDRLMPEEIEK